MGLMEDLEKDAKNIDMSKVVQYAKDHGITDMEEAKKKYMEHKDDK